MAALARLLAAATATLCMAAAWTPAAAAGAGPATSAWRCGAEGRVYSDTPCAGGREIELPASRPAADVRAAQRLAQQEATLAERLRREREAREAAALAANALPVSFGPARRTVVSKGPARPGRMGRSERRAPDSDPRQAGLSRPVAPKLARPQPPASRGLASDPDAGERTWQATAPASRRAPG